MHNQYKHCERQWPVAHLWLQRDARLQRIAPSASRVNPQAAVRDQVEQITKEIERHEAREKKRALAGADEAAIDALNAQYNKSTPGLERVPKHLRRKPVESRRRKWVV